MIAPTPYRKTRSRKLYYRNPAYLFTNDLRSSVKQLLQIYFDRWQIEVNHREEKDTLGVGQAQLWNATAVPKQPALVVAAYSALLLASLKAFGAERGSAYAELPKWRRYARRPSCLDLVTLLRKEITEQPQLLDPSRIENRRFRASSRRRGLKKCRNSRRRLKAGGRLKARPTITIKIFLNEKNLRARKYSTVPAKQIRAGQATSATILRKVFANGKFVPVSPSRRLPHNYTPPLSTGVSRGSEARDISTLWQLDAKRGAASRGPVVSL